MKFYLTFLVLVLSTGLLLAGTSEAYTTETRPFLQAENGNRDIEELIYEFVEECMKPVDQVLNDAEMNESDICAYNRTEQFVIQNTKPEYENDVIQWLQSHCFSFNKDDFTINSYPGMLNKTKLTFFPISIIL